MVGGLQASPDREQQGKQGMDLQTDQTAPIIKFTK